MQSRKIHLKSEDRVRLEAWLQSSQTPGSPIPKRLIVRARIVMGAAEGRSGHALSSEIGVSRAAVQRCLDRYEALGISGLNERPRSGRQKRITPELEAAVLRITLEHPIPKGSGGRHWRTRRMAEETGLHHTQVARIWRAHGLKPDAGRAFVFTRDPYFIKQIRDVLGVYLAPPETAIVFAFEGPFDETAAARNPNLDAPDPVANLHARAAARATTPASIANTILAELDLWYDRSHGLPRDLAPVVRFKRAHALREEARRIRPFKSDDLDSRISTLMTRMSARFERGCGAPHFLPVLETALAHATPPMHLHVLCMNYGLNAHPNAKAWLDQNPRVHFHFVPGGPAQHLLLKRFSAELIRRESEHLGRSRIHELADALRRQDEHWRSEPDRTGPILSPFVWMPGAVTL